MEKADQLEAAGDYEKAAGVYQQFIESHPGNPYISQAKKQKSKMASLAEARDYEELKTVMVNGTAGEKIAAAQAYIENHPNGAHRQQIDELIDDMSSEYFIFVKNRLNTCEDQENWGTCIELCENYIELYDNSHTDQLKQLLPEYQKRQRDEQVLATLKDKAAEKGADYQAAKQVFQDYLEAYPDTTVKEDIRRELARLDQRIRQKRIDRAKAQIRADLRQASNRFVEKTEGTVLDKKTGLMWTLVDSSIIRPDQCLSYDMAQEYVNNLSTGGYSDWQMPSPEQLAGIYKNKPFFPTNETKWYWSSENYSSYSEGWHKIVDTVTGENETNWEVIRRDATECGAVRAVRKPD
jgi:tetratricopeptide (TPR) repeat protein